MDSARLDSPNSHHVSQKLEQCTLSFRYHSGWLGLISLSLTAIGILTAQAAVAQTPPSLTMRDGSEAIEAAPAAMNLLFVDPRLGNDTGNGNQGTPFRTITQALRVAPANTTILLATGTYSAESGETFPLRLRSGITLQGNPNTRGQGVVIRGGGTYLSRTSAGQNVTILGADRAGLTGVTVTNSNPRGYGLWIESSSPIVAHNTFSSSNHDGISIVGNAAPMIRSNYFTQNGANGITIFGTSQPEVQENIFEDTGFGINVSEQAAPRIIRNRITRNRSGVVIQEQARPLLRGNSIESNEQDGIVAIAQSQPDLGTAADPGNNVFQGNGQHDIAAAATSQPISAVGNQLASPTTGRLDLGGSMGEARSQTIAAVPAATPPQTPRATISRASAPPSPSAVPSPAAMSVSRPPSNHQGLSALPVLEPASPIAVPQADSSDSQTVPRSDRSPMLATVHPSPSTRTSPPLPIPHRNAAQPNSATESSLIPEAVEIPVPLPLTSRPVRSETIVPVPRAAAPVREITVRRAETATAAPSTATAIDIPVPPPARAVSPPSTSSTQLPDRQSLARSAAPQIPSNLLPVPSSDVPIGDVGGLPTVTVSRDAMARPVSVPTVNPDRAVALGLRYRVVVEADSEREQAQVRSIVPSAFRINANGRVVMQVGAYSDRANADETVQMLNSNGLQASVQPI